MYKIYVDGALLWADNADSAGTDILTPKLKLDVNGAGSLSFVMPPGNLLYNSIKKLKSIITGEYMSGHGNGIISIEAEEQVAPGRVEYVKLYFDENGRISKEDARWRMRLSEGLAPYQDEKTGKYGYVGEDGTWVIAPTFDFARDFKDGYAVVSKKVTLANGKEDVQWGTICHPI